jgi:Domain of unknown function (DUF4263)
MAHELRISAERAAAYLRTYIERYQREHRRLTAAPPEGAGFPDVVRSPYLTAEVINCIVATDGAAIADFSGEPKYDWHLAGGPAFMVDLPGSHSRVPQSVIDLLKSEGIYGKPIGIYRICFDKPVAAEVWSGTLPEPTERATVAPAEGPTIDVSRIEIDCYTLVSRLTYGALGPILDIHLPDSRSDFWQPTIVRDLGFVTADREHRRFFSYLELLPHADISAWDERSAWARAKLDVRRDLEHAVVMSGKEGATISVGEPIQSTSLQQLGLPAMHTAQAFADRLTSLESSITGFQYLLDHSDDASESIYQDFLTKHPLLLDIYGEVIPKPNFVYPMDESPLGKRLVQPDFLIRRPGNHYMLVEIERPGKLMQTKAGQSRAEVGQAVFQIGEFKDFILDHYDRLKEKYPGINRNCSTRIVISRAREDRFGGRSNVRRQLQLLQQQHSGVDELITYDDLLDRAKAALAQLSAIPSAT